MIQISSLFFVILLSFSGCAKSPEALVFERYNNLKEDGRVIEKVYDTEHTVIYSCSKTTDKYKDIETIIISDLNEDKEWKIQKTRNNREWNSDKKHTIQEKFLEWKNNK